MGMTPPELALRLSQYQPQGLSKDQWNVARSTVVTAVVSTGVSTDQSALVLLSHLARFLLWHPAWDRTTSPDLGALLQEPYVEAYVAASAKNHLARPCLRRVARAIGAVPEVAAVRRVKNRPAPRRFWTTVVDLGSFAALAGAYRRCGYAVMATIFEGLISELATADWDIDRLGDFDKG